MGYHGTHKPVVLNILPPFPLGKRVTLSPAGKAHFQGLGYIPPIKAGVVVRNYRNLVKVADGEYSGWFANFLWEVV